MIFKNSLIIGIFTIFSVLLGVLRDRLLAVYVGVGGELDVYNAAFRIPDLTLGLLFAFVSSATIIPFLTDAIKNQDKQSLEERLSSMFFFFGGAMVSISLVILVTLPLFAKLIVPGFSDSQIADFILYTRILMLQPILLGLSTLISTFFQAKQQFYIYGTAPLLYTGAIIGSIFTYDNLGVLGLVLGVIVGAILHITLQAVALLREGIRIKPNFFRKELIKEQLKISLPRSGSVVISQLRALFFASFATTLGIGVLSAFIFAQRVFDVILQVVAQTVSSASVPVLSGHVSAGEHDRYVATVKSIAGKVVVISTFCAGGIFVLKDIVVRILFGGGQTVIVSFVSILMAAVPFAAFNAYMTNAMAASKDTKTQLYSNIVTTIFVVIITLVLRESHGIMSIVYGFTIGSIIQSVCIIAFLYIKKHIYAY